MIRKFFLALLSIIILFSVGASAEVTSKSASKSTIDDQVGVEVTVYNKNLGLVKDSRKVDLEQGEAELRFMDVASTILPETVSIKSLNQADNFTVLEQNYEYDLMSYEKLLDKYVGKKVTLVDWNKYQDRKESVEGILLSNNKGQPIYEIGDSIYLGHPGYQILPEIPDNLIAKPTLTWLYLNSGKTVHELTVSYLANNIGWKADYVLILNETDDMVDLSGWVTLDNRSGTTYKDAKLKLVAGDIHRAAGGRSMYRAPAMEFAKLAAADSFEEKAFFEYHIYNLKRKTTIKNNQKKQVSLLNASDVKADKKFILKGNQGYFLRSYRQKLDKLKVDVYVEFKNSKTNNLGMPIPAGVMRLYKRDDDKSLQFIGEDRVDHTPKDEEIKLKIGQAFDIVAERIQKDYRAVTNRLHESEWEVTIRNHKKEDVTVEVIEPVSGNWEMINSSHPYEKEDAFTIKFEVNVPRDGETVIKYRVKVGL